MSTRKLQLAAAVVCGILLLVAGTGAVAAQTDTTAAGPEAVDTAPNMLLSYQGTLRDAGGNPVNDAAGVSHTVIAQIYDTVNGSTSLWGPETHTGVVVRNGHFSLLLGSVTTMSTNLFSGKDRFLKLTVDGTALTPLQRLASVPYAVSCNYANSLAAPDGDPLAPISVNDAGNVTVASPYALLFGSATRQMVNLFGTTYGIGVQSYTQYFRSDSDFAWYIDGVHSDTRSDPGAGGTAAMILNGSGNLGIGTTAPEGRLHVQTASGNNIAHVATSTNNIAGVEYTSNSKKWQISKRPSGEGDELRFYYHDGSSWQSPAVRVKPDGSVNIYDDLTFGSDQHKPIFFRKITSTDHCYFNYYSNYNSATWSCGFVSFTVNVDINEHGEQSPAMRVRAWINPGDNNDWTFSLEATDSCGEDWEAVLMCIDNRLVSWGADIVF